jgi:hypothetical protein
MKLLIPSTIPVAYVRTRLHYAMSVYHERVYLTKQLVQLLNADKQPLAFEVEKDTLRVIANHPQGFLVQSDVKKNQFTIANRGLCRELQNAFGAVLRLKLEVLPGHNNVHETRPIVIE